MQSAKLREELGDTFYVTIGLSHTLMILPAEGWEQLEQQKKLLPLADAQKLRFLFANAVHCEPDKQGRILLPVELRRYAGLQDNAVLIGVGDKAEIWDAGRYDELEQSFLQSDELDTILSTLAI